jgi:tRNA(Ile)-lysidine synthase
MASSKKPRSADPAAAVDVFLADVPLRRKRVCVGLSGGLDSVALLHILHSLKGKKKYSLRAVHVHHGLSPNADGWAGFCRRLCGQLRVPFTIHRVKVTKAGKGLEAAARDARYEVFTNAPADFVALAHHQDDQAETVLMNLLRGAGLRGASGMAARSPLGKEPGARELLRPFLEIPRESIAAYAREHGLEWIEDESNADEGLTRNFVRRRLGPLLAARFPAWKQSLARAARHFSQKELDGQRLLREFLSARGLRAPSEARLVDMLKQLTSGGARTQLDHDGATLHVYRGEVRIASGKVASFAPLAWKGERTLSIPALGGELRFRPARGKGIVFSEKPAFTVRLRSGGERLQPDPARPRRTLKNLFQEAGVPPWERERLPLLYRGDDLVWAPGLGVDVRHLAGEKSVGWIPEWRMRRR